jgi:hypothetical protein
MNVIKSSFFVQFAFRPIEPKIFSFSFQNRSRVRIDYMRKHPDEFAEFGPPEQGEQLSFPTI